MNGSPHTLHLPSPTDPARDEHYMRLALEQARLGEGRTSPNPMVGVVIVKGDRIIATGYHSRAGAPHAERMALETAGPDARGAEVYVNLEPCCHWGRTGPCSDALIQAGVARVITSISDPNPLVAGKGIAALMAAGIEVRCGVLTGECERINAPFFKYIQSHLPFVIAKYAMTLDGKIATRAGDSHWITSEESRHRVHQLRNVTDAVLVGARTLVQDDPALTTRGVANGRDPVRVVLDARGEISAQARVLVEDSSAPTWVVCAPDRVGQVKCKLTQRDDVIAIEPDGSGLIPVDELLMQLGRREIMTCLVEGGARLLGSLLDRDQIDQVVAFIAPKLFGGAGSPSPIGGLGVVRIEECSALREISVERLGDELMVTGYLHPPMSNQR